MAAKKGKKRAPARTSRQSSRVGAKGKSKRSPRAKQQNKGEDFFNMLREDHIQVRNLFSQLLENRDGDSKMLFGQVIEMLEAHTEAEESLLYPLLEERDETMLMAFEAIEEHNIVDSLMNDLDTSEDTDARWFAKAKVMWEMLEHHIMEEEGALFPKASTLIDEDQQKSLAAQYLDLRSGRMADVTDDFKEEGIA